MVMLMVPGLVAGGRQTWMRSPSGSAAPQSGWVGAMSCPLSNAARITRASRRSKVRLGSSYHDQTPALSTPISPGRLTTTSVVSGFARNG